MRRLEYTAKQGDIEIPIEKGKVILSVRVDGVGIPQIISSGIPGPRQVLHDDTGDMGKLVFGVPMEKGEIVTTAYQDKIYLT